MFEHTDALDSTLAEFVAQRLNEGLEERGAATLVVSGGSTPLGFFRCLADIELPWPRIQIVLADERWVPIDHPDSNEGQLRRIFPISALASLLSLRGEASTPEQQVIHLNEQLRDSAPFDLVILGMGNDAHTHLCFPMPLSYRPGSTGDNGCLFAVDPPGPHQRISMTLARLLNAEQIIVHITGEEKAKVLQSAWLLIRLNGIYWRYASAAHTVSVFCDRLARLATKPLSARR